MEIKPVWLMELAPHFFSTKDLEDMDRDQKKMPKAIGSAGEATR